MMKGKVSRNKTIFLSFTAILILAMLEETNNHGILAAKVLIPVVVLTTFAILIIVGVICYMKKRKIVRDSKCHYCNRWIILAG